MNPNQTTNKPKHQPAAESYAIPDVIENYHQLDAAMLEIQRGVAEKEFFEVTPEFFSALTKGCKTNYLTYGSPGIKIYIKGTKEACDRDDAMTVEHRHEHVVKNIKDYGKHRL